MSEPSLERLSRFTPDAGSLDRDALLFAAGRSSARPNRGWMTLASLLAVALLLGAVYGASVLAYHQAREFARNLPQYSGRVQESLRVNDVAEITTRAELMDRWDRNGKRPRAVLVVTVREAFLHCGKALIRSRLWQDDYKIPRTELPPYGQMLKDQIETTETAEEIQASVENGYANKLY